MSEVNQKGYFGIGVYQPKNSTNLGTLWRSAYIFNASFIFVIGARCASADQPSNTVQAHKHIPLYVYQTFDEFSNVMPHGCRLIGVEQWDNSIDINKFEHPQQCAYLLGAEDHGLPKKYQEYFTGGVIQIPTSHCLNVAVAGSIIMYDRSMRI